MENILLLTKLRRPHVPPDHVPRPRLVARLNERPARALTLLSAPAGSGKSTLLAEWADTHAQPTAWLSLDKYDNDLTRFLQYTIAALRTVFPDACAQTLALLTGSQTPPLQVFVGAFISEVDELASRVILALDDFHLITNKAIHEFLSILIQNEPPKLHLVIVTRRDPLLPLMQQRAAGNLVELRGADLRFSLSETQAFLAKNLSSNLPDRELDAQWAAQLNDELEGWAAGLRLAALSIRDSSDLAARSRALQTKHQLAQEYLVDEVLARQKTPLRRLLIYLSSVDRFSLSLARVLVEDTPASTHVDALFDELRQANLFLISLDDQAQWFRFHHLFQDLLHERLARELAPEQLTALQLRASAWFEQNGWIEDALECALKANEPERAAELIETHAHVYFNQEAWRTVEHWLTQIPEHIFERRPLLQLARAWVWSCQWRLDSIRTLTSELEPKLERGEFALDTERERLVRSYLYTLDTISAYLSGANEKAVQLGQTALELAPLHYRFLRGTALFYFALGLQALGRKEEGLALLQRAESAETDNLDEYTSRVFYARTLIHLLENELAEAESAIRYLHDVVAKGNLLESRVWADAGLGRICYKQNRLEEALVYYAAPAEFSSAATWSVAIACWFGLALVYQALGRKEQADAAAASARQLALDARSPLLTEWCTAFEGHLALLRGELERAKSLTRAIPLDPQPRALLYLYIPELTKLAVLIAEGTPGSLESAASYLEKLTEFCTKNHTQDKLMDLLALRVLLEKAQGNDEKARQTLQAAVDKARPGELIRTFVDHGRPMRELLQQLAAQHPDDSYLQKILAAFSSHDAPFAGSGQLVHSTSAAFSEFLPEMLTDRELEILRLLQSRLSNKEIAEKLTISLFTVQTHTSNIYAKLGVSGRRQAVIAAVKLGLLAAAPPAL